MEIYENVDDLFLDGEIWKDIEGYNGDYQVSNFGRVKSFKKYHGTDVRILSPNKDGRGNDGHLYVSLYKNGKGEPKKIHRLMFESFNNYKLKKSEVIHHIDKNPSDNDLNNFQLMINSEHTSLHNSGENHPRGMLGKNHSDETKELMRETRKEKFRNGELNLSGENNPASVLTEQKVIEIRKLSDEGNLTQKEIAGIFGVKQNTISAIKNKKSWKHV